MSGPPKKEGGGGAHGATGHERWLLTYADMITLLMALFIMLYAMSELDKAKYQMIAAALERVFGGPVVVGTSPGAGTGVAPLPVPGDAARIEEMLQGIGKELYADFARDGRFTVRMSQRGLIISLAGSAAFDSGSAAIKSEFYPLLDAIAERLKEIDNDISLEGFADSDPISTPEYPSNWYLSVDRALRVRDYLESKGIDPERFIVVGYGSTRPVWSNATEEGKAKNRRVDVVILREKHVIDLGQEIEPVKK